MVDVVDKAFSPGTEAVDRHMTAISEHAQLIKAMDMRRDNQVAVLEQLRFEVSELRSAQRTAEESVKRRRGPRCGVAARRAVATRAEGGNGGGTGRSSHMFCRRMRRSHVQQGGVGRVAHPPIVEVAKLRSCEDADAGETVAKRWIKGRDQRAAARRVAILLGALRGGSGWRGVEVESASGELVPLRVAPDKHLCVVRTEVAGKKYINAMRTMFPEVSWRLLREEGVISVGCQQVVRIVAKSSTDVRLQFSAKAFGDQRRRMQDLQAFWDAVAATMSVQPSSYHGAGGWRGPAGHRIWKWNTRALYHSKGTMRRAKLDFERRLIATSAVIKLQENRSTSIGLRLLLRPIEESHQAAAPEDSGFGSGCAPVV